MPESKQWNEVESNNWSTNDELLDLKKNLADEIVDKLAEENPDSFSIMFKWLVSDYLVDEKTINDIMYDNLVLWNILWIKTSQLEELRKEISNVETKEALDNLRTKIFQKIWENKTNVQNNETWWNSNTQPTTPQNWWTQETWWTTESWWKSTRAKVDTTSESYEIDHLNFIISDEVKKIHNELKWVEKPDLEPFACALKVYNTLKKQGKLQNTKYLTVVDFTKKKWKKRFFIINMDNDTVEYAEKVWHWKNSWWDYAKYFSNEHWSNQSSLGAYLTPNTITKSPKKGRSWLRQIKWLESSNEQSDERGIAIHEWSENWSQWCFTLPKKCAREIMDKIKWWSLVFAYAKSKEYFAQQSNYFKENPDGSITA